MAHGQVQVRSTETGLTFNIARSLAESNDTLIILTGNEAAGAAYEAMSYDDLRAEVARRNAAREDGDTIQPASRRGADLIAALVADDTEKE